MFLRSAGLNPDLASSTKPTPVDAPLMEASWTAASAPITNIWGLLQNDRAAALAAAVIAGPFIYLLCEASVLGIAHAKVAASMASLSHANKAVRADRSMSIANLDAIQKYLSVTPLPNHAEIVGAAQKLIKGKEITISEWTYDSGNLELVVRGGNALDPAFYIEAFEREPFFSHVTASSGNEETTLRLKMQIEPSDRLAS